ncbi:MAG: glycosyltransferase family 39 protein [Hyphomicrobiaceae bacterium]|nr:glycosyltransferase family 39 protein [Hyphomicrobiaceae bacterium]
MAVNQPIDARRALPAEENGGTTRKGLAFVLLVALAYCAVHTAARLLVSDVLGEDDVIDTVLSQDLRAGYEAFPRQPPLYNWLLWAVQQITGPHVVGHLLIKYAALTATAGFLFLAARRILRDPLFALLSVESLALIYSIAWRYHEGFTHEVLALTAVMATLWLIVRIGQDQRPWDWPALGLTMGLGLLTEPAYAAFLVAVLLAALVQPSVRGRLLRWPLLACLALAVIVAAPYLAWLIAEPARVRQLTYALTPVLGGRDGILDAVRGPVAYLMPLLLILPIVFPRWLATAWDDLRRGRNTTAEPDFEQLVLYACGFAFALSLIAASAFNVRGLAVHVLMPLYVGSVIWLFGVARRSMDHRSAAGRVQIIRFARIAMVIAVVAFAARAANMIVLDPVCKTCRWGEPYSGLAAELRARGFDATGTIVALEHETGGNLRAAFPQATVVARHYPHHTPAGTDLTKGDLAIVWEPGLTPAHVRRSLRAPELSDLDLERAETVVVPWHHAWRPTGWRTSTWKLIVVDRTAPGR